MGIVEKEGSCMSLEEEDAIDQSKKEVKFDSGRYTVSFLWKRDAPELKSNYYQPVRRLESVEKQLN